MSTPSPWHQATAADLAVPGHDPRTCPACRSAFTPAAERGRAAARQAIDRAETT